MNLDVIWTTKFKKDYKKAIKQGFDIELLDSVITSLAKGETLDKKFYDHDLKGNWKGHRECHLNPDWLLIYKVQNNTLSLVLARTGSHSELFK